MDSHKSRMKKDDLEIVPLCSRFLRKAAKIVDEVFAHYQSRKYTPSDRLRASLEKKKEWKLHERHYVDLEYFVLKKTSKDTVIGVVGFYRKNTDPPSNLWIDWLAVDHTFRGKGYGSILVDWAISYAKEKKITKLSLYTTNNKEESKAQTLYSRKNFKIKEVKPCLFWTGFTREKIIA